MVLNLIVPLKNYKGEPLTDEKGQPTLLRDIILNALNYTDPTNKETPDIKARIAAYKKSLEVVENDKLDFTVEELAKVKENINRIYLSPLIVGQISEIIENSSK